MADRTASVTGNWADTATWGGSSPPSGSQTWEINAGVTVTLAANPGNLTGAGTINGQLTISCEMTGYFGAITVASGGKIYARRNGHTNFRVAGLVTLNGATGLDYGTSGDPLSNASYGHCIEMVCTSDGQSNRYISAGVDNFMSIQGASMLNASTLAQAAAAGATEIYLTDDMALRAGTVTDWKNGKADAIIVGQNPTLGVGVGAQNYEIDIFLVTAYDSGTKKVTLADIGAGQSYWPRGGSSPNYNNIETSQGRDIGTPVWRLSSNVVLRGSDYNLRPERGIDFGSTARAATIKNCILLWANGSSSYGAVYRAGSNLTIENVHFAGNSNGWCSCTSCTNSGSSAFSGNSGGWYSCIGCTNSGSSAFSGNSSGWQSCAGCTNSGSGAFSGNNFGWYGGIGCTNSGSGAFSGNSSGWYSCIGCTNSGSSAFSGNSSGWQSCAGCTNSGSSAFSGNSSGWNGCAGCTNTGTGNFSNNTYDIRRDKLGKFYHTSMGASIENYEYNSAYTPFYNYTESIDHDGFSGDYKAWGRNCVVTKDTSTKPSGKAFSFKVAMEATVGESTQRASFYQTEYLIPAGQTLTLDVWMKKDANSMTVIPKAMIVDPGCDPLLAPSYSPLDSFTMADDLNWQTGTLTYQNTKNVPMKVIIRGIATNASSNFYFYAAISAAHDTEIAFLVDVLGGKRQIVGNQLIISKADNTTEVCRFNLYDENGDPAMVNIYKRTRV